MITKHLGGNARTSRTWRTIRTVLYPHLTITAHVAIAGFGLVKSDSEKLFVHV